MGVWNECFVWRKAVNALRLPGNRYARECGLGYNCGIVWR
jgi:hypothetical protein